MALDHDHPAYKRKVAQAKQAKRDALSRIFDADQYSRPADEGYGCYKCRYHSECASNLWRWYATPEGITYEPLRCFAEHPEYNPDEWRARQSVQLELQVNV